MYPYFNKTNLDWIMVQTIEQINQVLVQPNQKAWIMVQSEPVFALKTADNIGTTTTELYRFEKYEPKPVEYVTRDEIKQILEELRNEPNNRPKRKADTTADNAE